MLRKLRSLFVAISKRIVSGFILDVHDVTHNIGSGWLEFQVLFLVYLLDSSGWLVGLLVASSS